MVAVGAEIIAGLTGPIQQTVENCREESQIGLFACVDHILKRTRLNPNQVNLLQRGMGPGAQFAYALFDVEGRHRVLSVQSVLSIFCSVCGGTKLG